jgi:hypothetical protein
VAKKKTPPDENPSDRRALRPAVKGWALTLALAIALAQGPWLAVDAQTLQTLPWWGGLLLATLRFFLLWFCAHILIRIALHLINQWRSE